MQLQENSTLPVVATVVVLCLFLAGHISDTTAAPQGNKLNQELKATKQTIVEQEIQEKDKHKSILEHNIQIREAVIKEVEKLVEDNKKSKCGESVKELEEHDSQQWEHHIQIREAVVDKTERSDRVEHPNKCIEVEKKTQDLEHKIQVRQTAQSESQGDTDISQDDLVASLIRQRDDFIAAAAIPEAPRPVQNVRMNLNSGL